MRAYVIATDGLRVRKSPTLDGKIYKTLQYRDMVEVDRIAPDWCKLINTPNDLWVHGSYLSATDPAVPFVSPISYSRINLHTNAGGWVPDDKQLAIVRANRVHAMVIPCYQPQVAHETITKLRQNGVEQFILRATAPYFPVKGANFAAMATYSLRPFIEAVGAKSVMVQLHNEPNLYAEGLDSWENGKGFNKWFIDARNLLVKTFPGIKIGFSPLSPGGAVANVRADERKFIEACTAAIAVSDWVAVHCYYGKPDASDLDIPIKWWKSFSQKKPIICTEAGPSLDRFVSVEGVRTMFKKFAGVGVPAFGWILDGTGNPHFDGQSWVKQGIVLPSFG